MRGVPIREDMPHKRILLFHKISVLGGISSSPFAALYFAAGRPIVAALVAGYCLLSVLAPLITQVIGPVLSRLGWLTMGCALITFNALQFPPEAQIHYFGLIIMMFWFTVFGLENVFLLIAGAFLPIAAFAVVEIVTSDVATRNGDPLPTVIRIVVIVTVFIAYIVDVTLLMLANRRAETQLREEKRLLAREVKEREKAEALALEMSRAKSEFLASMSHELRTPLSAILGYTEMLREDEIDPQKINDFNKIWGAGNHLLELLNNLLSLSKIEAGKMDIHIEDVDLDSELRQIASTLEPLVKIGGNSLLIAPSEDPVDRVYTDRLKVRQILINLIGNATKFTKNGTITIDARRIAEPARFEITVEDTGVGISPEGQAKLFSRFSQAERSTERDFGGTGLGLSLCAEYCRMLGGSIGLKSELGKGTALTITLPNQKPNPKPSGEGKAR